MAIALAGEPKILLLDEPTAGMSQGETDRIIRLIEKLVEQITIVLIEHDVEMVLSISDSISVLHQGTVIAEGSPDEIPKKQACPGSVPREKKTMKILELEDIHTYYGDSHVIQGLSMYVDKGEAVSLLGRNGVGKTTTLRSIMSLTPPRRGTVRIGGADCTRWPTHRIAKEARVAYIPADRQIFPGLSVDENLKLSQRQPLRGVRGRRLDQGEDLRELSPPQGPLPAGRIDAERRRTTDAGHRQGPDGKPGNHAPG